MSNITFKPVIVKGGRKFQGFAYDLGFGTQISHSTWAYTSYSLKMWDPATKQFVYANPDFVFECQDADPVKVEADKQAYISNTIDGTIAWCRQQKPNAPESEVLQFARNVLRKHHPEMMDIIDEKAPDQREVVTEVENTVRWARGLKTRACYIYGRFCPGGKPLSEKRQIEIAKKTLERRGITKLEGFEEAWSCTLTINGLIKYL